MGKYTALESDLFTFFGSDAWKEENLKTYPVNFNPEEMGAPPFVRISIVPEGGALNALSISGVLMIEIFTVVGNGPRASSEIADTLDRRLQEKTFGRTQLFRSAMSQLQLDRDNTTLARTLYSLPFIHFGAL